MKKQNHALKKQNTNLIKINKDLNSKIAKYENPHTPSSAKRFKKKRKPKSSVKKGAPKGHKGTTRPTPKAIQDALFRVAKACKKDYHTNIEKVRNARWNYIDETGMKVLGEKHWLWVFRTPQDEVVVCIRPSRGQKVLKEIFGEDFIIPAVVDGWRVYNNRYCSDAGHI